ncbi:MAG: FG-GAP-like repeat-containing protein, partial [Candidatus Thermoplasmatota archaeon]|nr:FG-GAP-like repeat-containing protein [Candidatus Thermoplasmatota archaeon]
MAAQGPDGPDESRSTEGSTPLYSLLSAPEDMHHFGADVTNLGDTGGDGLDDLVISYFLKDLNSDSKPGEWGNYVMDGRLDHEYSFDQLNEVDAVSTMWDAHANRWLGDVNGDGYDDMVSLAMTEDDEWSDVGVTTPPSHIDVRYGGPGGLSADPSVSIYHPVPTNDRDNWLLYLYGGVGDVNGDGYNDLAVIDQLELDLYYGSEDGISRTSNFSTTLKKPADAEKNWDRYSLPQLKHGDINGDGYSDIVIGNVAGPWITVYNGSAEGVSSNPDATDFVRYWSGMSITSPVDVNGDAYEDVVMVQRPSGSGLNYLAIDAYLGSSQGLPSKPSSTSRIWQGNVHWAREITLFVDINGDGLDDLLIEHNDPANWTVEYGEMNQYIEYDVFFNQGGTYPPTPHYTFQVPGNYSGYGSCRWGLNAVGDFDGDGYGDVAIGIPDGRAYTWPVDREEQSRPGHMLIIHGKG